MTELVLANGDICIATSIDPPALADLSANYDKEHLCLLETDVTKIQDVTSAFAFAQQTYGHVNVCFNNAGIAFACEVEDSPDERARKLFEVNFWGNANVMREAVRFFREVNGPERGGKLLQMASMLGIGACAGLGYYVASKHAVEGLTKTLVQELNPDWNIQVTIVEPDFMRTPILDLATGSNRIEPLPAYVGGAADQNRNAMQPEQVIGDPQKAMELVHKVAQMDKLPLHLPIGPGAIDRFRETIEELTKAADEWETMTKQAVFTE